MGQVDGLVGLGAQGRFASEGGDLVASVREGGLVKSDGAFDVCEATGGVLGPGECTVVL